MADNLHEFHVFVMSDLAYEKSKRKCPHCQSDETPEQVDYFGNIYRPLFGDILKCVDCNGLAIVAEDPYIELDGPILTKWSVPGKYKLTEGVLPQ